MRQNVCKISWRNTYILASRVSGARLKTKSEKNTTHILPRSIYHFRLLVLEARASIQYRVRQAGRHFKPGGRVVRQCLPSPGRPALRLPPFQFDHEGENQSFEHLVLAPVWTVLTFLCVWELNIRCGSDKTHPGRNTLKVRIPVCHPRPASCLNHQSRATLLHISLPSHPLRQPRVTLH